MATDERIMIRETSGNAGINKANLIALRENPPKGGSPARFNRRSAVRPSCTGESFLRVERVLGEEVRLFNRRNNRGATIII